MSSCRGRTNDLRILTTSNGHVVFFPLGPLIGYLLPSAAFTSIAPKVIRRFDTVLWLFFFLAIAATRLFNVPFDLSLTLLFAVAYTFWAIRVRRVTRKMTRLPHRLSAVTYASSAEPEKLYHLLTFLIFMTGFAGWLVVLMPLSIACWGCLISFIGRVTMYSYIVSLIPRP